MTLSRILVANRGEIALRIVRTARDLGATSILPYTPEDLMSPAAELADEAYAMPEGSSYTDAAAVLELSTPATDSCLRTPTSPVRSSRPASPGSVRHPRPWTHWGTR